MVQIGAFVDAFLASYLGQGAVVALTYAQSLYHFASQPVWNVRFGGRTTNDVTRNRVGRGGCREFGNRLDQGLHRIAFIVPSSMAFIALGDVIAAVLYQTGRFTPADSRYVWAILAGSAVGYLPPRWAALPSTYYALNDTKTPLRFAVVRVLPQRCSATCALYRSRERLALNQSGGSLA